MHSSSNLPISVIKKLKDLLPSGLFFLNTHSSFVFLCGADNKLDNTGRWQFFQYAQKHIKELKFFFAEDVFKEMENPQIDLLTIEKYLADYADCILIILESDGAKVELGAFSLNKDLAQKILVVNNKEFKGAQSFINLGPLKKIMNESIFNGIKHVYFESISTVFADLERELEKIKKNNRVQLHLSEYNDLQEQHKTRLLFLADMIWLLTPISYKGIIDTFKKIYGDNNNYNFIKTDLAFLKAIELINSCENSLYYSTASLQAERFCSHKSNQRFYNDLRAEVINYYFKRNPQIFENLINQI